MVHVDLLRTSRGSNNVVHTTRTAVVRALFHSSHGTLPLSEPPTRELHSNLLVDELRPCMVRIISVALSVALIPAL